jgi:hypothetical protein
MLDLCGVRRGASLLMALALFAVTAAAQSSRAVSPSHSYERLLVIVRMKGSGTHADPRRPDHIPSPDELSTTPGLIGFSSLESDDHDWALVELVAVDRSVFQKILADKSIKAFDRKISKPSEIEDEFGKHRKGFHLSEFPGVVVR